MLARSYRVSHEAHAIHVSRCNDLQNKPSQHPDFRTSYVSSVSPARPRTAQFEVKILPMRTPPPSTALYIDHGLHLPLTARRDPPVSACYWFHIPEVWERPVNVRTACCLPSTPAAPPAWIANEQSVARSAAEYPLV